LLSFREEEGVQEKLFPVGKIVPLGNERQKPRDCLLHKGRVRLPNGEGGEAGSSPSLKGPKGGKEKFLPPGSRKGFWT